MLALILACSSAGRKEGGVYTPEQELGGSLAGQAVRLVHGGGLYRGRGRGELVAPSVNTVPEPALHPSTKIAPTRCLSCSLHPHPPSLPSPGKTCQQADPCASNPCANGGHCVPFEAHYICRCTAGFHGANCKQDVNECNISPPVCKNGGSCTNEVGTYQCSCKPAYTGQNCEHLYVPCNPSPCQNGGTCRQIGDTTYDCTCLPGRAAAEVGDGDQGPSCSPFSPLLKQVVPNLPLNFGSVRDRAVGSLCHVCLRRHWAAMPKEGRSSGGFLYLVIHQNNSSKTTASAEAPVRMLIFQSTSAFFRFSLIHFQNGIISPE